MGSSGGSADEVSISYPEESPNQLSIEKLFNSSWLPQEKKKDLVSLIGILLYSPIGFCFVIIRFFILVQFLTVNLLFPESKLKRTVLRLMSLVLGVTVTSEGEILGKTFVSNHVTIFDNLVIYLLTNSSLVSMKAKDLPKVLKYLFNIKEEVRAEELAEESHLFHPEGEETNGNAGLMQFQQVSSVFSEKTEVQPIALSVTRYFLNSNSINGGFKEELFFLFFLPNTHFHIRFLPMQSWNPINAQKSIARALSIQPTKYDESDRREFLKKLNFRPPSVASMVRLVQQQLHPIVLSPESIITAVQKSGSVEKAVEELRKAMAEPSFKKSASERMMSFQERKRLMIYNARQKYAEKNGIVLNS